MCQNELKRACVDRKGARESGCPERSDGYARNMNNNQPSSLPVGVLRNPRLDATLQPIAAIDLGTNNCRLLVARIDGDRFEVVDGFSRIVRLGEGVERTGRLSEAAMHRTIQALRICARMMARHGVSQARCVATEACRRASNADTFVSRVRLATGLDLEVLDHHEEARLGLLGCVGLSDPSFDQFLMMDVGGGSTELVWFRPEPDRALELIVLSLPVGVVTMAERFGSDPDDAHYLAMQAAVWTALDTDPAARDLAAAVRAGGSLQGIGTSGTVTTLAALHMKLARYERNLVDGVWLPPTALDEVARELRARTPAERAGEPCIGPGRADLVIAGTAIVQALSARFPFAALRVADRGLREGILATLIGDGLEAALERQFGARGARPMA